ncbi:hypothetical protein Trydic_g23282 [Trypoxylus dichotomus]
MHVHEIFAPPDEVTLKMMRKDLNEDPKRLERQMELFKEWLRCEPHLPEHVDDHLIENFVRHCKCDLEKAKKKFENFLISRINLKTYYKDRDITDSYFDDIELHRHIAAWPKLTPEGFRIGYARLKEDVNTFDFARLFHLVLIMLDVILAEDTCAGYIGVLDLKNLSAQHIGKINFKILAAGLHLIYNVAPCRFKSMHFLNVPYIPEPLIALIKKFVPAKIINRAYGHKNIEELSKYVTKDYLPKEYGGSTVAFNDLSDNIKRYLLDNRKWESKVLDLKLSGDVPNRKRDIYSFEDFEMGGSFRQLSID